MAKRGYFHRSSIFPNSISIWSQSKHTTGHLVKTLPSPWGRHGLWLWAPWPGALKAGGGGWGDRSGCFSFLLSGITAQGLNLLLHIFCLIFSRLAGKVNPLPAILPWLGALSASWLICNRTMLSVFKVLRFSPSGLWSTTTAILPENRAVGWARKWGENTVLQMTLHLCSVKTSFYFSEQNWVQLPVT